MRLLLYAQQAVVWEEASREVDSALDPSQGLYWECK
jgi:hypothetical protein